MGCFSKGAYGIGCELMRKMEWVAFVRGTLCELEQVKILIEF